MNEPEQKVEEREKVYARRLADGSVRILSLPRKRSPFHAPKIHVPPLQWTPETGMTRYAWARSHTPKKQLPFFLHLKRLYVKRAGDLEPGTQEVPVQVIESGPAIKAPEILREFYEDLTETMIETSDPTGNWCFRITAEWWREVLCDRLSCWHRDGRTMPDWALLLRFRSWVLEDHREACVWLPDQRDIPDHRERYRNDIYNSLDLLSPRRIQPDGQVIGSVRQGVPPEEAL